jgi:hypothetical protein
MRYHHGFSVIINKADQDQNAMDSMNGMAVHDAIGEVAVRDVKAWIFLYTLFIPAMGVIF